MGKEKLKKKVNRFNLEICTDYNGGCMNNDTSKRRAIFPACEPQLTVKQ